MRIAYTLTWNLCLKDGVTSKVKKQVEAWHDLGHEVEVFCASALATEAPFSANLFRRGRIWDNPMAVISNRNTYKSLCDAVREFNPDVNYMRWEFYKSSLAELMRDIPTVIELNAIYESEFKSRAKTSMVDRVRYFYNLMTSSKFERCAAGFVGVTQEILDHQGAGIPVIPSIAIPNSTNLTEKSPVPFEASMEDLPRVVYMIGSDNPWHGVDDFLEFAQQTLGQLEFDMVAGYEFSGASLPNNVSWHCSLDKEEFQHVFKQSSCALGTVGLHTKNMEEACPLKVRDYLSSGLPVILPYLDTAFLHKDMPDWVLQVPNAAGGLLLAKDEILDFVNRMTGRRISLEEVAPYVGSDYWEARRMAFLEEVVSTSLQA
jgi:hypothetical protein